MGDLNQSGSGELKNQGNEIGCGSCLIQQNKLDPLFKRRVPGGARRFRFGHSELNSEGRRLRPKPHGYSRQKR